jgi:hypothetical protein
MPARRLPCPRTRRLLNVDDRKLAALLSAVDPRSRDILRRLVRSDQFERDEFAAVLLRQRTAATSDLADLLDLASINPAFRQQFARVLGELEAKKTG